MKKLLRPLLNLILYCLLLAPAGLAFGQSATPASTQIFDEVAANKSLTQIKNDSGLGRASVKELQAALLGINRFQLLARKCIDTNTVELNKLNQRLIEITPATSSTTKNTALTEEEEYLNSKKAELSTQLSECRLFSLRADEATATLSQKLRDLVTIRLLYAHPNILENLKGLPDKFMTSWQAFDLEAFKDHSGLAFFHDENVSLLLLPLFVVLSFFYTNNRLKKKIIPYIGDVTESNFSLRVKQALIAILSLYLPIFAASSVLAIFFSTFTHSLVTPSYLALTSYGFLAYLLYASLVRFYFSPPAPAERFTLLPQDVARKLAKRLNELGVLGLITYVVVISLNEQNIEHPLIDLFRSLVITLVVFNFVSIVIILKDIGATAKSHPILRFLVTASLIVFLVLIVTVEYLGYHLLAYYFLSGIATTVLVTFLTRHASKILTAALEILKGTERSWQQELRSSFGLKRTERFIEILWLGALFHLMLWLGYLLLLLKIWGLEQANFQIFTSYLVHGIDIGKLHIVPSRILVGALFFIILVLATRWLRSYIVRNTIWQLEAGNREALAAIISYIGFAAAFLISALIAGVNFSGLALIAGALAVGIGFGLQNIVNNFFSGIILLIERPIKMGDRIIIGKTEGYVKKISIRSTRILTTQRSDVIVPNSELISQQVTNYMLHDLNFMISTSVGLAYGSDTELAKNTLLSIAKTHPQVIADRKDLEPAVYFKAFGESSLNFDLTCVIRDVNKKTEVVSDLNFAIDKAFREKGIEIAFPQREIKLTYLPQNLLPQ